MQTSEFRTLGNQGNGETGIVRADTKNQEIRELRKWETGIARAKFRKLGNQESKKIHIFKCLMKQKNQKMLN